MFKIIKALKENSVIVGFIYIPPEDSFIHQNFEVSLFAELNLEIDRVNLFDLCYWLVNGILELKV